MGVLEPLLLWLGALPATPPPPLFPRLGTSSVVCWIAHTEAEFLPTYGSYCVYLRRFTASVYRHGKVLLEVLLCVEVALVGCLMRQNQLALLSQRHRKKQRLGRFVRSQKTEAKWKIHDTAGPGDNILHYIVVIAITYFAACMLADL